MSQPADLNNTHLAEGAALPGVQVREGGGQRGGMGSTSVLCVVHRFVKQSHDLKQNFFTVITLAI